MSIQMKTIHGLKFTLSEQIAGEIGDYEDNQLTTILKRLSDVIESAEIFPSLSFFVAFIILLTNGVYYKRSILIALAIFAGADILSFSSTLMMTPSFVAILKGYQIIAKFFIHYCIMIVAGIIVKPWYAGIVAIIVLLIISLLRIILTGGYRQRESFNDKVAKKIMNEIQSQN